MNKEREIVLKKQTLKALAFLRDEYPGIQSIDVDFSDQLSFVADQVAAEIRVAFLGDNQEDKHTFTIVYPKNWIEHFKRDVFPQWLCNIFPIKYTKETRTVTFSQTTFFPQTEIRGLGKSRVVIKKYAGGRIGEFVSKEKEGECCGRS